MELRKFISDSLRQIGEGTNNFFKDSENPTVQSIETIFFDIGVEIVEESFFNDNINSFDSRFVIKVDGTSSRIKFSLTI